MLSRIFWVSLAGIALVGGMILQGGGEIFNWGDHREISAKAERAIEKRVEHAIDRSFDKMEVTGSDGREIEVPAEAKRAMADAVGRLVKAEAGLAIARTGDSSNEEVAAARTQRDKARADVDRLEAQMRGYDRATTSEKDALREQIRREVEEDVRATVRDSVRS